MNWLPNGGAGGSPWLWGIAVTLAATLALLGGFGIYLLTHLPGEQPSPAPGIVTQTASVMTPVAVATFTATPDDPCPPQNRRSLQRPWLRRRYRRPIPPARPRPGPHTDTYRRG